MTPLEMIAEWEKGCSNTIGKLPETCSYCTVALIEALKRALSEPGENANETYQRLNQL